MGPQQIKRREQTECYGCGKDKAGNCLFCGAAICEECSYSECKCCIDDYERWERIRHTHRDAHRNALQLVRWQAGEIARLERDCNELAKLYNGQKLLYQAALEDAFNQRCLMSRVLENGSAHD